METTELLFDEEVKSCEEKFHSFEREDETFVEHSYTYPLSDPISIWIDYDKLILDESEEVLIRASKMLGLGDVSLKNDENDIYPPTFYIKASLSLTPEERLILSEKIFDILYNYYEKRDKLDDMNKFFFRLYFKE